MNRKKIAKGQYGYINKQRKREIFRTVFMFALSLAIYGIGILSTGTNKNLLTIVAILGCLPASKSAINMIMFLRAKGCSESAFKKISSYSEPLTELYDMFFTSYEKNYQVSHIVVKGNIVCGFTEDSKCELKSCEKHMEQLLKKGCCKNVAVKIYSDMEKYCEGLDNLKKQEQAEESEQQENIFFNLLAIAL